MVDPSAIPEWVQVVAAILTISTFVYKVRSANDRDERPDRIQTLVLVLSVVLLVFIITQIASFPFSNGSNGGEPSEPLGGTAEPPDRQFKVISTTEDAELTYRFVVNGTVAEARADRNGEDAGSGDAWENAIVENDNGTVTVTGKIGNQDSGIYDIKGNVTSFERIGGNSGMRLELDGEFATDEYVDDLRAYNRTFEIISTSEEDTFTYQFIVDGEVYEAEANGNQGDIDSGGEWEDTIRENDDDTVTVFGREGLAEGDVFLVNGEIEEFWKTGGDSGMILQLDERDVTAEYLGGGNSSHLREYSR